MSKQIKIQRALLSVTDKTNIVELAGYLDKIGCEIISTGGTAKVLSEAGIEYTEISKVTGNPEAFGGRMKTISFAIESALLYDRERDAEEAERLGIKPIDLVVCNLYPFSKYQQAGEPLDTLIHYIDIGGPTMIRAAAKNFASVAVLTDPADYHQFIDELQQNANCISYASRKILMAKAFNMTADYDAAIAQSMDAFCDVRSMRLALTGGKTLRYGENAHQDAAFFRLKDVPSSLYDINVLNGIELSYNNILDLQAAVEAVSGLEDAGCVIVKHNNPCGMAETGDLQKALELAWAGDPVSAFGGIIAFNRDVQVSDVAFLGYADADKSKKKFIEIIAAPAFSAEAISYLSLQKNLRIVTFSSELLTATQEIRITNNAALLQSKDSVLYTNLEVKTASPFAVAEHEALIRFGLAAVRHIKSNAIGLVRKTPEGFLQLIGMGSGQPNRVDSIGLAVSRAKKNLNTDTLRDQGVFLISDAFFPFEDNVDLAHDEGIAVLVEPGGSIRDKHVIARAEEYGMTLIFSGNRHFKH
jgi:phosphoribosylaminoimidazolecarboxamide formyltransferase/IMP cyclohydrolase